MFNRRSHPGAPLTLWIGNNSGQVTVESGWQCHSAAEEALYTPGLTYFMVTYNYISENSRTSEFLGLPHHQALLPRVKQRDAPGRSAVIEETRQRCVHVAEACSYFTHTEAGDDILTCFGYFLKYDINFDN